MNDPRWATPDRIAQCLGEDRALRPYAIIHTEPPKLADPRRWWAAESCTELARGFVGNSRFASQSGEKIIPRTNRNVTRKWYRSGGRA